MKVTTNLQRMCYLIYTREQINKVRRSALSKKHNLKYQQSRNDNKKRRHSLYISYVESLKLVMRSLTQEIKNITPENVSRTWGANSNITSVEIKCPPNKTILDVDDIKRTADNYIVDSILLEDKTVSAPFDPQKLRETYNKIGNCTNVESYLNLKQEMLDYERKAFEILNIK